MRLAALRLKLVVEPGGAVALGRGPVPRTGAGGWAGDLHAFGRQRRPGALRRDPWRAADGALPRGSGLRACAPWARAAAHGTLGPGRRGGRTSRRLRACHAGRARGGVGISVFGRKVEGERGAALFRRAGGRMGRSRAGGDVEGEGRGHQDRADEEGGAGQPEGPIRPGEPKKGLRHHERRQDHGEGRVEERTPCSSPC